MERNGLNISGFFKILIINFFFNEFKNIFFPIAWTKWEVYICRKRAMKVYNYILLLTVLTFSSCQEVMDNYWERQEENSYLSPYKGIYVGTYTGSDQGTLRIEISDKNLVYVTRVSTVNAYTENFEGGMIGPSFNRVISRTSGFTILGNVTATGVNKYEGRWEMNPGNTGTWTLNKE